MRVGTKSVLFGVHCWFWHPLTVVAGWWLYHGRMPNRLHEWLAILFHDLGYIGCSDMDGASGLHHPLRSVFIVNRLRLDDVRRVAAAGLVLGHSRSFAAAVGIPTSSLYAPDKLSILFDPAWFYILRATLSGEIHEYMANAKLPAGTTKRQWLNWYRANIRERILKLYTVYGPDDV